MPTPAEIDEQVQLERDPNDPGPGGVKGVDLLERRLDVGGVGGRHALGGDRVARPDGDRPDPHFPRRISPHLDHSHSSRQNR